MFNAREITEHVFRERLALTAYVYTVTRNYHLAEDFSDHIRVLVDETDDSESRKR